MSRPQQDEHEAWMFHTYSNLADVLASEGTQNVLQDLEDHFPEVYEKLVQGLLKRADIKKGTPCLLLQTPDS